MPHFLVFNSYRRDDGLRWDNEPVGLFAAPDAETACKAAAYKRGNLGTYFAVQGYVWGVELLEVDGVHELGAAESPASLTERLRALERQLPAGEA